MKLKLLAACAALAPTMALAQAPTGPGTPSVNPTNQAIDDAQRPDKNIGTTDASPQPSASDQPAPTTDPTADPQRLGTRLQGSPHGDGGVPRTVPKG